MSAIFVKVPDVDGEAVQSNYVDQIECFSMHHAIELPIIPTGSSRTEASSEHGPIMLAHNIDKASPVLRHKALSGANLGEVVITRMRMIDGSLQKAETVTLQNAYLMRVDTYTPIDPAENLPGDQPYEVLSFSYDQINWEVVKYEAGTNTGTVAGGYSTAMQDTV